MTWRVNILTLFPEMFPGYLGHSLSGKALEKGLWSFNAVNIRDFATDKHKTVDDTPFGGGAGMVMRADVIERALLSLSPSGRGWHEVSGEGELNPLDASSSPSPNPLPDGERVTRPIYLSPRGTPLTQSRVKELAQTPEITLLCGRYEGVDQRILDAYDFEEISVGDYVLSGGEPAALALMDACIRLLPGVMGNTETPIEESFSDGLLEYPHYTRPASWTDLSGKTFDVPPVLTNGDHAKINAWRRQEAEKITKIRRPDLLPFSQEDAKTQKEKRKKDIEEIASIIVDCAFHTHKELGPGLLESVYEMYFIHKLKQSGLSVRRQIPINLTVDGMNLGAAFKADLIVEDTILIELKAVETILPVHKAQTISYLKMSNLPLGFLINFNTALIKDGIRRFANTKQKVF
jgi:tRNA (guanine37-N1)-methyltransferase